MIYALVILGGALVVAIVLFVSEVQDTSYLRKKIDALEAENNERARQAREWEEAHKTQTLDRKVQVEAFQKALIDRDERLATLSVALEEAEWRCERHKRAAARWKKRYQRKLPTIEISEADL